MKQIKVGLLGFGTIGTGVVRLFQNNFDLIKDRTGLDIVLARIADLDITTDRGVQVDAALLTSDAHAVLDAEDIDIVIELIGGYEPARSFVLRAIENGKHVVTANKALLALHGEEIFAAADRNQVEVMYEASVGGGIPIITSLKENLCANRFLEVFGILNGTCNYILTRMTDEGEEFATILKDAQRAGYAEADPTFDVEGIDAAHKLALLVSLCFGTRIDFNAIYTEGISSLTPLDIQFAKDFGFKIKLLAIGKHENGSIEARVHPTMIPEKYPLAEVDGAFNAVRVNGDFVGPVMLYGQGAGMDATASAVMGDVMSLARSINAGRLPRTPGLGHVDAAIKELPVKPMDEVVGQYYLRFTTTDRPGVLAKISGVLGRYDISIASMVQPERHAAEAVPIVFMTHEAVEMNVRKALEEIDQFDFIREKTHLIRVEASLD
ncbi:MAG TPA: homoserine dehydrogenase [Geothermobacteraceae bacterium]|nr:homoserine dehydrogenase [Geothermobacteraceae bacterium]